MASHEVICAVLAYLISEHSYGTPTGKQLAVNRAGVRSDQLGEAKEAFEELRDYAPFIDDCDERGIKIDNSKFGKLADYLYDRCEGWDQDRIHSRLKHYEGWSKHDWSPPKDE